MKKNKTATLTFVCLIFTFCSCGNNITKSHENRNLAETEEVTPCSNYAKATDSFNSNVLDFIKEDDMERKMERVNADSIISIFKMFWPSIDSIKNKLMQEKSIELIISSNERLFEDEPNETCSYYLDTVNYAIQSEYYSGGVSVSELRILFSNNDIFVISSNFSGTRAFTTQNYLSIFKYDFEKKFFYLDSMNTKLFKVEKSDFFKESTPDSIISEFANHSSNFFNIFYTNDGVAVNEIFDEIIGNDIKENKWLKGNVITFYFNNNRFYRTEPYFSVE